MTDPRSDRRWFYAGVTLGAPFIGVGVVGLIADRSDTKPFDWLKWFVGGLVTHDLVLAPLVFATAVFIVTRVPLPYRPSLQGGLIATGIVSAIAAPFVLGYGRSASNPSVLPNDYGMNLLVVLGLIWLVVAVAAARAWSRTRRHRV